jgi:hypothetical protein
MHQKPTLETRLTKVESELAELKRQFIQLTTKKNWIKKIEGTFADRPEFGEVLRLGKEIRDAEIEQYP